MSLQETEENQELHRNEVEAGGLGSSAVNRFNMLSLNGDVPSTADDRRFFAASTPPPGEKCSMCGSLKRRSPSSSSHQEHQPNSKKPNLQSRPSSAAANSGENPFRGFNRLPLPAGPWNVSSPSLSTPILRRCASDLVNSPGNTAGDPISQPLSPEDPVTNVSATTTSPSPKKSSASLPPLPPTLRRTVSDLSPTAYQVTGTPPQPSSATRTFSGSPISSESPDSQRLKRMKACMRGMRQWWDQVLLQEDALQDINAPNLESPSPVECECECESESEGVSVERNGDWLVIKFECPCAKGYEIRLSGQSCYYKLM